MTKRECELFFALIVERLDTSASNCARAVAITCRDCLADERYARERRELERRASEGVAG
jgi:RNase P subunit RPR2